MMDALLGFLETIQSSLFQQAVLPTLHAWGFMSYADEAYDATGFLVLGMAQLALIALALRPLEAWIPAERWNHRRGVRADVLYTFLQRSGALPLLFFAVLAPLWRPFEQGLRGIGYLPPNLEDLVPLLGAHPLAAFLAYAIVIDFFEYWRHRLQHRLGWWWALHAVHHSQRQLSFWADDRNHVLDGLIEAVWLTALGLAIGIPSGQFVWVLLGMRFVENLSHANVRLGFGWLGDRLLVSPRFHRTHHGVGVGHEGPAGGCNFGVLFPVWDLLFGTARFIGDYVPTGIRDQAAGVDYGEGFWRQQWLGLKRLWRTLTPATARAGAA